MLCLMQVQALIDGDDILPEDRPKISSPVVGQARWNNTLMRCSCCTGRCLRGAQGGWEIPAGDTGERERTDSDLNVACISESKVDSALEALLPAGEAKRQQEPQANSAPCCQCCEQQFASSSDETLYPQACSVTSWEDLVHDIKLLDRLTSQMRYRRNSVRVTFKAARHI